MPDLHQTTEAIAGAATKAGATAYTTGYGFTLFGFLAQVDWMQVAGVISIIGTFIVNWYYKHKHFKLEEKKLDKQ